jgi:hypothetical protein
MTNTMTNQPANNLENILERVIKSESTIELELYWLKRYTEIISENLFTLAENTVKLAFEETVSKPSTPSGSIVIANLIDENKQIDEFKLQNTIETSVRLLDGIINIIAFDARSKEVVGQYRKIALGVVDYEEFIAQNPEEKIEYLCDQISNSTYRTSETLSEEKGQCLGWNSIKKELSAKKYEYWYNLDTGEIKSSFDVLAELKTEEDYAELLMNNTEIVPRRNSHILYYPNGAGWDEWSDRVSVELPEFIVKETAVVNNVPPTHPNPSQEGLNEDPVLPDTIAIEDLIPAIMEQEELHNVVEKGIEKSEKDIEILDEKFAQLFGMKTEEVKEVITKKEEEKEAVVIPYGIGEIVVETDGGVENYYQIVGVNNEEQTVDLTDKDTSEVVKIVNVNSVKPARLEDLISNANIGNHQGSLEKVVEKIVEKEVIKEVVVEKVIEKVIEIIPENFAQVTVEVVVFTQAGQVILDDEKKLINFQYKKSEFINNGTNHAITLENLKEVYNLTIVKMDEIGVFFVDGVVRYVYLAQLSDTNGKLNNSLHLVDLEVAIKTNTELDIYLEKTGEVEAKIKRKTEEKNNEIKQLRDENQFFKQKIRSLGLNLQVIADANYHPKNKTATFDLDDIKNKNSYNFLHRTTNTAFSKFFPTIEQLIEEREIGRIYLKIQYDAFGAKNIYFDLEEKALKEKDKLLIKNYINLVNTSLASGASLTDIAYILEHQGKGKLDFGNQAINKILLILSSSLMAFPQMIEMIEPSEIIVVPLPKIIESINTNQTIINTMFGVENNLLAGE